MTDRALMRKKTGLGFLVMMLWRQRRRLEVTRGIFWLKKSWVKKSLHAAVHVQLQRKVWLQGRKLWQKLGQWLV